MALGTLYYYPNSPRSSWLLPLAKYLQLEIQAKSPTEAIEFPSLFMLKKAPAFISENGFKLTEMVAIALYFVQISGKKEFAGVTDEEKASQVKWLSFLNSDFLSSAYSVHTANSDEEKLKFLEKVKLNLAFVDEQLSRTKFLGGDSPLVSDMYAYKMLASMKAFGLPVENPANVERFYEAFKQHPLGELMDSI